MREAVKDRTRLMHILEAISNIMEFKEGVSYDNTPLKFRQSIGNKRVI